MRWFWQPETSSDTGVPVDPSHSQLTDFRARVQELEHPDSKVEVKLPANVWCAVLATMSWRLPDLEDQDESELVELSEACFRAQRKIRKALRRGS